MYVPSLLSCTPYPPPSASMRLDRLYRPRPVPPTQRSTVEGGSGECELVKYGVEYLMTLIMRCDSC